MNNRRTYLFIFFIALLIAGCSRLFQDYQDETFAMDENDVAACKIFGADSLSVGRIIDGLMDTSFTSRADSISFILQDSLKVVTVSENHPWQITLESDTSFMVLSLPSVSLNTNIYINDPINIHVYSTTGQALEPGSRSPSLTMISSCSEIRAFYNFNLSSGNYLIKVTADDLNNTLFVLLGND